MCLERVEFNTLKKFQECRMFNRKERECLCLLQHNVLKKKKQIYNVRVRY